MNTEQQLKLQAFLDGELPEGEAAEILAWTRRDGAAAALLDELKNTRQAMRSAGPHLSVPETREFYWSTIEREIQRREPQADTAPEGSLIHTLRRFFFPAVALGALVLAALIAQFSAPNGAIENLAEADTPTVETTLANSDATTYRDASEGTTLVWFSYADAVPTQIKKPAAIN